jgi:predicted transcriptional regulator of viral defense system
MARSTYISTNLTEDQISFLRELDENEILYFSLEDLSSRLGQPRHNLNELVENLRHKGLLDRIENGEYTRPNFHDTHVLGSFISRGGVIAYWTALHQHGLTDRFPNKVFIKTTLRKRNTSIFGTKLQFVTVHPRKMVGIIWEGYGDKRYPWTDLEATMLDCFDQPRYAGDWPDLVRAFHQARMDGDKLIAYAQAYENIAVIKRMGYLATLFEKKELNAFVAFALSSVRQKYSLFEPGGPDEGMFLNEWKLRMNVSEKDIMDIIQSPY